MANLFLGLQDFLCLSGASYMHFFAQLKKSLAFIYCFPPAPQISNFTFDIGSSPPYFVNENVGKTVCISWRSACDSLLIPLNCAL